jgi:hypothetical protein
MKLYSNLDDTYLVISGRLFHVNIKHKKIIYNNKFITPYVISPKIINFKKIPNKIFSNFLFHIHKTETKYLNYEITEDVAAKKCSKYICFGVDEYFINNVVIPYLIKHKMPILIRYSYHIMQPFFFYTKTQETKDKFDYHIQQLLAGIKYSGDPIKFLDRIFYDRQNNPIEKLKPIATKIVNNYYNLIQQLYTQHDYSIIGKDFILLSLSKNIYGSVYISKYTSYFNPERPSLIQTQIRVNNIQPLDPKIAKNKLITQIIS